MEYEHKRGYCNEEEGEEFISVLLVLRHERDGWFVFSRMSRQGDMNKPMKSHEIERAALFLVK